MTDPKLTEVHVFNYNTITVDDFQVSDGYRYGLLNGDFNYEWDEAEEFFTSSRRDRDLHIANVEANSAIQLAMALF